MYVLHTDASLRHKSSTLIGKPPVFCFIVKQHTRLCLFKRESCFNLYTPFVIAVFVLLCLCRWFQIQLPFPKLQSRCEAPQWFPSTPLLKPSHLTFCRELYHQDTSQNLSSCLTTSGKFCSRTSRCNNVLLCWLNNNCMSSFA